MPEDPIFPPKDRSFAESSAEFAFSNPFERDDAGPPADAAAHLERLVGRARERLAAGARPDDAEARVYAEAVAADLLHRHGPQLAAAVAERPHDAPPLDDVAADVDATLGPLSRPDVLAPRRLLEHVVQLVRARHHLAVAVPGRSAPARRLRAAAWRSVFTHDLRRHLRAPHLTCRVATLVVGTSLRAARRVAEAVARSAHVAFDERTRTLRTSDAPWSSVDVAAASPADVEAELFGTRDGRAGRLEAPGTLLVSDVAELDARLQARLCDALEASALRRAGEARTRPVAARLVAATRSDPSSDAGRLDSELSAHLAADRLVVPPLAERLADAPDDLEPLVRDAAERLVGRDEAEALTVETIAAIRRDVPADHAWPGDDAELERCVRAVAVHGRAEAHARGASRLGAWLTDVERGALTADALLGGYCALVYGQAGSYEGAARRLGLDRRTVKAKLDRALLDGIDAD